MGAARKLGAAAMIAAALGLQFHQPRLIFAAVAVALLAVPVHYAQVRTTRRATQAEMLYGVIGDALGCSGEIRGRAKWRDGRLVELSVRYPHSAKDGKTRRDALAVALVDRLGADVALSWRTERCALVVSRKPPVPAALARVQTVAGLAFGASAKVTALGWDGDRLLSFRVDHGDHRDVNPEWRAGIDHLMCAKTGLSWTGRWDLASDQVTYSTRPPLPAMVPHPADALPGSQAIPFAVDHHGATVAWDPGSSDGQAAPHLLVIGSTGAGKTVLVRGVAYEAARRGYHVAAIDPKRVSLKSLRGWPGITEVATDLAAMVDLIDRTHAEVEARYAHLEAGIVDPADLTPHLLIIEEATELIERCNAEWKSQRKPGEHPAVAKYRSIARLGREGRVHLLICLQRPDAAILSGEARDNLAARVTLGKVSKTASRMMENGVSVDAKAPRGRAIAAVDGQEREVQIWWTPAPGCSSATDKTILDGLRPPSPLPVHASVHAPVFADKHPGRPPVTALAGGLRTALAPEVIEAIRAAGSREPRPSVRAIAAEVGVSVAAVHKYLARPGPALHVVRDEAQG